MHVDMIETNTAMTGIPVYVYIQLVITLFLIAK